jgi:hypothetical protein
MILEGQRPRCPWSLRRRPSKEWATHLLQDLESSFDRHSSANYDARQNERGLHVKKYLLMLALLLPLIARTEPLTFQLQEEYSVPPGVQNIINADTGSIFGIKPFSTVEQVIATLGKPSGMFRIDEFRTGLIYGKSCSFIFRKGKFQQFIKSEYIIIPFSSLSVEPHPFFDRSNWLLIANGKEIKGRMKYEEIDQNSTPASRYNIGADAFSADLIFTSSSSSSNQGPKTYTLFTVDIKFNEPLASAPAAVPVK